MNMSNLCRFEGRLKKLRWWLEHVEKRMTTDLLKAKQHGPEKVALEQVEQYQQEVLKERFAMISGIVPSNKTFSQVVLNSCNFIFAEIHLNVYVRRVKH